MRSRRTVEDWRREVYRVRGASSAVKVYLSYLADYMRTDRKVSRPRTLVARDLGISERTVDYRNAKAVELGLLSVVTAGRKHVTAVYQGLFPDAPSAQAPRALRDVPELRADTPDTGPQRASSCAPEEERTSSRWVAGRDVGSYEKPAYRLPRSEVTSCEFHPWQPCPEDCRNAPRESA